MVIRNKEKYINKLSTIPNFNSYFIILYYLFNLNFGKNIQNIFDKNHIQQKEKI